jgi:hypothetical protein
MHPTKLGFISVVATLCLAAAGSAAAQTITLNSGTPCTYSQYTQTVGANGVPSFVFTAAGCTGGGGPTPTAGTMQFSAATYPAISSGGTTTVLITNTGRQTGGGNALTGTVESSTTSVCTVPANSTVNFSDSDLNNKSVTVTAVAQGTCTLTLTGTGTGSPSQTSITILNPTQPGTIAFTTGSQSAVAGQASVTFTVAQSGAGASAPAASVSYNCISAGVPSGSYAPAFTPSSSGTLNWASGENGNKTFSSTVPALPGGATSATITCQITSPTGGATTGQTTHQVTVTNVAAPVCTPSVSTVPGSLVTGTGGTANFTANCTNSPTGYTWSAITAGAPALTNATTATPSATFGGAVAAGTYQYSVTAQNGGGNSAAAVVNVTVGAAPTANCVVKVKSTEYPGWVAGDSYLYAGMPTIQQAPLDTIAYQFALSDILDMSQAPYGSGSFQLYDAMVNVGHTISVSATPCDFSSSPTLGQCQSSPDVTGKPSLRYARWDHPASTAVLVANNYCRMPNPGAQQFLYVNVRFNQSSPNACTLGFCGYYPLYQRF